MDVEILAKLEGMEDTKEIRPSESTGLRQIRKKKKQTEAADTKLAWVCTRLSTSAKRKDGHMAPSLIQKQSPTDNYLQMKI